MTEVKDLKSLPNYVPGQIINEGPIVPTGGTPTGRARRFKAIFPPVNDGQYRTTVKAFTELPYKSIAEQVKIEGYPVQVDQTDSFIEDPSWRGQNSGYQEDENGIFAWHRRGGEIEMFEGKTVKQVQTQLEPTITPEPQLEPIGVVQSSSQTDREAELKKWIR